MQLSTRDVVESEIDALLRALGVPRDSVASSLVISGSDPILRSVLRIGAIGAVSNGLVAALGGGCVA